jgi:hypothetical protein
MPLSFFNVSADELASRIRRLLVFVFSLILIAELFFTLFQRQWINSFLILAIIAVSLAPGLLNRRYKLNIPSEFQIMAIAFVFAALFLGEIRSYYERIWWWDIALHASSGLLLGIFGFLLVYVLNEDERIDLHLRPRFVALFAFLFAVTTGTLWEVFEFSMDNLIGTNMQKPMFGDASGLTDTMWDLIMDTFGAGLISLFGWWHLARKRRSLMEIWVRKFITRNPQLFGSHQQK